MIHSTKTQQTFRLASWWGVFADLLKDNDGRTQLSTDNDGRTQPSRERGRDRVTDRQTERVHVYVCVQVVCVCACVHVSMCMYVSLCTCACVCAHVRVHVRVCVHVCVRVCVCTPHVICVSLHTVYVFLNKYILVYNQSVTNSYKKTKFTHKMTSTGSLKPCSVSAFAQPSGRPHGHNPTHAHT